MEGCFVNAPDITPTPATPPITIPGLALTRRVGQRVHIDAAGGITVEVASVGRGQVMLRFVADRQVRILREELLTAVKQA